MKSKIYSILIIFLVGFFMFLPSLSNGFVWDDEEQIVSNSIIQSFNKENIKLIFSGGAFNSGGTGKLLGTYYKPLMTVGFASIYSAFGPEPFFFHLLSVLIYIGNAILVFLIFQKFFDSKKSLFLSLLFLVHPLYSEVAFYAANLQDALFFFFGSLALFLAVSKKGKLIIALLLLCSLLSKETGIIFVIITAIFSGLVPSVLSISIYSVMRFSIAKISLGTDQISPIAKLDLLGRLQNIPTMAWSYIQNLIFPMNLVPNQHWVIKNINFHDFWLPLFLITSALGLLIYLTFKKSKSYYLFLAIFILGLGMHMQIFPLDVTLSGRWFYLSMFGLLGLLGHLKFKPNFIYYLVILVYGIVTINRSFDWKNGLTLYSHDSKIVKNDFNLENNLGVELYRVGKKDEAKAHFQTSVDIAPYWWTNWNNLGAIYEGEKDLDKAAEYYKKSIDNGNYYLAYENYAKVLIKQNKLVEARKFIKESLLYFPENKNLLYLLQFTNQKE